MPRASLGVTIADAMDRNSRLLPRHPALVSTSGTLSHTEFAEQAGRLAAAFESLGVRRQDRVSIFAMNCPEFILAYAACESAGYIASTVNFRLAGPEVLYNLQSAAPRILVFEEQYAGMVDSLRPELPFIAHYVCIGTPPPWSISWESLMGAHATATPTTRATEDDIAHLIFTSGTTGKPKGCMLDHRASAFKALQHSSDIGLSPEDRLLLVMPLFHVGAKSMQLAAQWRGACVHLMRSFDAQEALRWIAEERITVLHLAPTMVQSLLEHPRLEEYDLSSVRVLFYSAAPMPPALLRRGIAAFGDVFHQIYGQTEGVVSCLLRSQHVLDSESASNRLASVGQPYFGMEVRLIDDDGRDVPPGECGEIVYRGPMTFSGYWNDTVATLQTLRDGWVHSGDMGRLDADGYLYLVDRKKDMIISGGENIYCLEVESALAEHPLVSEVAVIGVPDSRWGETVKAVVVTRSPELTFEELVRHSKSRIASYKKPTSVEFVDHLPKLASGKIDKVSLRSMFVRSQSK